MAANPRHEGAARPGPTAPAAGHLAVLLGNGPRSGALEEALATRGWRTARAFDGAVPRVVLLHAADARGVHALLREAASSAVARGVPVVAVVAEAPADPDEMPVGADAYLVDPTADDLLEVLGRHVAVPWSRTVGGQHALDILDSLEDAVLVVDRERRVAYHNASGLAMTQRASGRNDPLLGSVAEHALPALADEAARRALRAGLEDGERSHLEVASGAAWLSLDVHPGPDGATLIVRDVTRRRALEEALLETRVRLARSEKVAFLGELVSGVAHEVRTPLVSLGNSLQLIHADARGMLAGAPPEGALRLERNLEEAWGSWERAVRIMKELARITRLDPPVLARLDLSAAMRDAVALFAAMDPDASRVRVDFEGGLYVHADARKLQQAVLNLLQNAIDASRGSGEAVRVTTRRGPSGRAELVVADAGPGMPPEVVARMYDPLFTTKKDATGLGLGVVARVVRAHGGAIACDTAPGRATIFTIALPLIQEAPP